METLKELLIKSYEEGVLTPEEQRLLEEALATNEAFRQEQKELEALHNMLADYTPGFKPGFADRVLETALNITAANGNMYFLFKRFALTGVAAIIALLISVYLTDGNVSFDALLGLSDLSKDNLLLALSTF
ncbi:MAG: hypothetical protein DRJ09_07490 [Bacteroidetes bacterium]|nr:MAG: hypothetical protein DRJ09_07490 [Bacteroidota bacterium]